MERVILIHGWGGNPDEAWMPDFKAKLSERGYLVIAPGMPDSDAPKIESWITKLAEVVVTPDEHTHFVGHSIGCQAIMRYLAGLTEGSRVGHIVFVAPWFSLQNLEDEERPVAGPWLDTPIDTDVVRRAAKDITAVFSDDDPVVPISDSELFRERLGANIVIEHGMGHMGEDSGIKELPALLEIF